MWTEINPPQPPFESSSVLYITLIYTSSMQELIMTMTMTRKVCLLLKLYKNQNQMINNASTWYVTKNIVKWYSILRSVTTLTNGAEVMTYDNARNATKWEKSCFRCKEDTWHAEFTYILQPPKYLIIVFNRLRYVNNNITKYMWSIHMDMTVVLGLHKFSLQATIDHHGP